MRTQLIIIASTIALLTASSASAAEDQGPNDASGGGSGGKGDSVLLGAKVGGLVPLGGLSPFVTFGVEAGYVFPWMNGAFAGALYVDYTAPKQSGSSKDGRIGDVGGSYDWNITEKELAFMPVFLYRFTAIDSFTPYAGIGPRIYLLESTVDGSAGGATISETTEQNTEFGFGIPVGAEIPAGPGGFLAELLFHYGGLDHQATGDTNSGALSLSLGYRLLL